MKKWLCYILFCFCAASAHAQVSFTIKIGSRSIAKNETLQVEYTVSNADALSDFKEPGFKDWTVLTGPMYSQQQLITNGRSEKSTSYIFILEPKKTGSLVVPGTTVVAAGRKLSCNDVLVNVYNSSARQAPAQPSLPSLFDEMPAYEPEDHLTIRPGERVEDKIRQLVFIKAEPNKTKCIAGEPILVTYKLYTGLRPDLQVSKQPAFSGSSIVELPFDDFPQNATLNGKPYRVYTFRKVQITPLQPGTLTLEPASVKATLNYVTAADGSSRSSTVEIKNAPLNIEVEAVPKLNGKDFEGPIGRFSLLLKTDNDTIAAGATNNLIIELNGEGNFMNVTTPAVNWPANTQHYEESTSEELDKQQFPVSGRKMIRIPFVANKQGSLTFAPVSLTYFDPASKKFINITSNSLSIVVTPPVSTKSIIADNINLSPNKYLWLIPAIALVVGFVFIVTSKKQKRKVVKEEVVPEKAAKKPESETVPQTSIASNLDLLYLQETDQQLLNACKNVLKEAIHAHGKNISEHEYVILESLHKTDPVLYQDYIEMMKHINELLYAPVKMNVDRREIISHTRAIAEQLS